MTDPDSKREAQRPRHGRIDPRLPNFSSEKTFPLSGVAFTPSNYESRSKIVEVADRFWRHCHTVVDPRSLSSLSRAAASSFASPHVGWTVQTVLGTDGKEHILTRHRAVLIFVVVGPIFIRIYI